MDPVSTDPVEPLYLRNDDGTWDLLVGEAAQEYRRAIDELTTEFINRQRGDST